MHTERLRQIHRRREIEQLCIVYPCICLFPKLICVHVSWILTVAVQHFGLPSPSRVVGNFGPMRFPQKWYFGLCKEYGSELVHDIETVLFKFVLFVVVCCCCCCFVVCLCLLLSLLSSLFLSGRGGADFYVTK